MIWICWGSQMEHRKYALISDKNHLFLFLLIFLIKNVDAVVNNRYECGSAFVTTFSSGMMSNWRKRSHEPINFADKANSYNHFFVLNGVPRLYGWMVDNFRGMRCPLESSGLCGNVDYLYLDMNAIIHSATHGNISPSVIIEDKQRMKRICAALLKTFMIVKPRKLMYLAVDGVCPSAKINQQRGRRFRLSKSLNILNEHSGSTSCNVDDYVIEKLPCNSYDNVSFNPSYISPGTDFTQMMDSEIKNWLVIKTTEGFWDGCHVVYSGTDVPGEGEHKIYDYIRRMNITEKNSKTASHLIYGLDADLMILSLATKLPKMYILREEHDYTPHILGKRKPNPFFTSETGIVHFHSLDYIDLDVHHFEILSMREVRKLMYQRCLKYVGIKYKISQYDFLNDLYAPNRLTDDFVLLSFLAGNDFLPHLPTVDLSNRTFSDLMNTYYFLLPKFKGFLTKGCNINITRLQSLFKVIGRSEPSGFRDKAALEGIQEYGDQNKYAEYYYREKCEVNYNNKNTIRKMCRDYIQGLFWNLSYYHNGCPSWDWSYKYHYAPLASDLADVSRISVLFEKGTPITPLEHLLAVSPPNGNQLLPLQYRKLSQKPDGELCEYFPEDFEVCQDGKQNEWEHVVKLPFLDTKVLSRAAKKANENLKYNILCRNKIGHVHVYHSRLDSSSSTKRKHQKGSNKVE